MSSDRRNSGGTPAPETAGQTAGGHERGHSPRAVSGADAPPETGAPSSRSKPSPPHKHGPPAPAPAGDLWAPAVPPAQSALEADAGADADSPPDVSTDPQEVDLEALTAKAEKADEYLDLAQRTKADFENYRKRAIRDAAVAQDRGVTRLALELLPAVDNLDRALDAAEAASGDGVDDSSPLVSGIRLVHADVIAALARVGIEPFSPKGEPFDPQHHEAIAQQPVDGAQSGTVVEVYQRGYRLGDTVLRPARVVVAA